MICTHCQIHMKEMSDGKGNWNGVYECSECEGTYDLENDKWEGECVEE